MIGPNPMAEAAQQVTTGKKQSAKNRATDGLCKRNGTSTGIFGSGSV
jgi:hypothetical protein